MLKQVIRQIRWLFQVKPQHPPRPEAFLVARPVLYYGISQQALQSAIEELQTQLEERGLLTHKSGCFDGETQAAVKQFQAQAGLKVDGVVGPLTWAALFYPTLSRRHDAAEQFPEMVKELQTLLSQEGFKVDISGCFDRQTERALKRFQQACGLRIDGVCGPLTWNLLRGQRPISTAQPAGWLARFPWDVSHIPEQIFTVAAIYAGVHFSPFVQDSPTSFLENLLISYSLTCIGPPILDRVFDRLFEASHLPWLQYAPYVVVGFLWKPIFLGVLGLIFPA